MRSTNQHLARQAHAMLLAANHRLALWSYTLRSATHADPLLSNHGSMPAPYTFWHPTMPTHPILHAFGAQLIYRQQETGLQRRPDSRGHHARCPGQSEQHGSVCVLDMDLNCVEILGSNLDSFAFSSGQHSTRGGLGQGDSSSRTSSLTLLSSGAPEE